MSLRIRWLYYYKKILRKKIAVLRVFYRDTQSYFAILLDDNNRKAICRLYLNGKEKYIALFDESKKEEKIEIESLDDLYNFSEKLLKAVENLDNSGK